MAGIRVVPADNHHCTAQPNTFKNSFTLVELEESTLFAGTRTVEAPQSILDMNVSEDKFKSVSEANFLPADKAQFFFTLTVVRTGGEVVLFDTGLNAAGITAPIVATGVASDDVTVVVLAHMHVKVQPSAEKIHLIDDGDYVVSAIIGMEVSGHTPDHMMHMLDSGSKQFALIADTANHHVSSLAYLEWKVKFDMDKANAAATRKRVVDITHLVPTSNVQYVPS